MAPKLVKKKITHLSSYVQVINLTCEILAAPEQWRWREFLLWHSRHWTVLLNFSTMTWCVSRDSNFVTLDSPQTSSLSAVFIRATFYQRTSSNENSSHLWIIQSFWDTGTSASFAGWKVKISDIYCISWTVNQTQIRCHYTTDRRETMFIVIGWL